MIRTRRVRALVLKDWRELVHTPQVIAPLVIVPLLFVVVIPTVVILFGSNDVVGSTIAGLDSFLRNLPAGLLPDSATRSQTIVYAVVVYFMAPFFLLIPVMVASIAASSSIVGEKERRTLEGLLYTPLTDRELVLGKVLVSMIPAVVLAWISFIVYAVLVNALAGPMFGGIFFPTPTWAVIIVALVPLVAFLATSLVVAVSGRSTTVQGAQGTAVLVVLPVIALVVGQATGLLLFDTTIALIAAAILLIVDVVVFATVSGQVRRERILTRL
jgi:ABC-type Na+ efflux pump permease subunit